MGATESDGPGPAAAILNAELNAESENFNVDRCKELIAGGADPKHIFYSGTNGWYDGDTSTCLYSAIIAFNSLATPDQEVCEERFVETALTLLEAGASADFTAKRGTWSRVSYHPLMDEATDTICQLTNPELRKRLLQGLIKAGVELNAQTRRGKQGNFGGYGAQSYSVFSLVQDIGPGSDLSLMEVYLDVGVNVNCARSEWSVDFDDDESCPPKRHETLLHAAIRTKNVDLVRLLVNHGADVNQNMAFTIGGSYYTQSCLQLALELGSVDTAEVLRAAGAKESVDADLIDTVAMFYKFGSFKSDVIRYHEGGQGMWTQHEKDAAEDR